MSIALLFAAAATHAHIVMTCCMTGCGWDTPSVGCALMKLIK
jgi:hypothetical protein